MFSREMPNIRNERIFFVSFDDLFRVNARGRIEDEHIDTNVLLIT